MSYSWPAGARVRVRLSDKSEPTGTVAGGTPTGLWVERGEDDTQFEPDRGTWFYPWANITAVQKLEDRA